MERLASLRLQGSWFDWDSCSRLRETVTKMFIERDLEPESFGRLTDESPLAHALIDEAAHTGKGRAYLMRVREALKDAEEGEIKARSAYIAKKLK